MAKENKSRKKELYEQARKEERAKKENNKTLNNIVIGIAIISAFTLIIILLSSSSKSFTYQGVHFDIVKFCDSGPCLTLYRTSLPVKTNGNTALVVKDSDKTNIFNIYLRNDPRTLNVNFNGTVAFHGNMVFNTNSDFSCNGEGGIAGANFVQLYNLLGVKVINDKNATCDSLGRYMYVMVQPGNETSIEQFGPSCYYINIKGCEVLQGTEKFMVQTFVQVDKMLNNQSS